MQGDVVARGTRSGKWIVLRGKDEGTGNDGAVGGPWCGFGGEHDETVGGTSGTDSADG